MTPTQALEFLAKQAAHSTPIAQVDAFNAACKALNDLIAAAAEKAKAEEKAA